MQYVDILAGYPKRKEILDKGFVELVDVSPRICPKGRFPEYRAVEAARTSFDGKLKSEARDRALIKYLILNDHSSPAEMCSVTFRISVPKAIAIQILRHRTLKFSSINEMSQRYMEIPDTVYNPLEWEHGVRFQSDLNHQGSLSAEEIKENVQDKLNQIIALMKESNQLQSQIYDNYQQMIGLGCAKEVARFWLPISQYTTMVVKMDLNNMLHFLRLRDDHHAQLEIQMVAKAMRELAEPLFPTIFSAFDNKIGGLTLTKNMLRSIQSCDDSIVTSRSEKAKFKKHRAELFNHIIGEVYIPSGVEKIPEGTPKIKYDFEMERWIIPVEELPSEENPNAMD